MTKLIKWTDTGPVRENILEVDESGGLYVLEGPIGSGKSHLLAALDDAINPGVKSAIPVRDGAPRAEVDVFGEVTLRRSRQSRRLGTLEFETLAGKFSISDLVEPGIDKPESADAKRIKALIQLTGNAKADPSLFYSLVGGQEVFDEFVSPNSLATEDLVTMAARVKADFEKAARHLEEKYKAKYAQAEAARLSANGIDINSPCDAKTLADEYEKATREESRLQAEKKAYEDAEARTNEAQSKLDKIGQEYTGLTLEEASKKVVETVTETQLADKKVNELKAQLEEAEQTLRDKQHEKELAEKDFQSAQSHFNTVESLTQLVEAQLPDPVLQLDLENAAVYVKTAREAVEQGALVRRAKTELENASSLKSEASTLEKKAITFRDAAHATDTVLAQSVQSLGLPLSVSGGRLIITNSDRNETKEELFADLSKGERVDMVIDIAIKAVKKPGRRGMFIVPQEFWEGLDESHQIAIARKLEGSGVIAVTAKAVDGEGITARVIDPFPLGG